MPTLMQRVYANRFEGGGKTIFTIHNGQGHTVDGPIIAVARLRACSRRPFGEPNG